MNRYWKKHSLTPCLCDYYTASLINFLHFLPLTAFFCIFVRSDNLFLLFHSQGFFGQPLVHNPCIFTQSFSSFLKTCPYHLNLYYCTTVIRPILSIPGQQWNSCEYTVPGTKWLKRNLLFIVVHSWFSHASCSFWLGLMSYTLCCCVVDYSWSVIDLVLMT